MTDVEVRVPSRGRRAATWIALGVGVMVIAIVGSVVAGLGAWTERDALDPESPAPLGMQALVEILRDQGVEVIVARDRATAAAALAENDATLVLPDAPALTDAAIRDLGSAAADLVLIQPRSRDLRLFLAGSTLAGAAADGSVQPDCDLPEAVRSGEVSPGLLLAPSDDSVISCYPSGEGWGLLVHDEDGRRVAAIDARPVFVNEALAEGGNAALAINLMGRQPAVVWYVPGPFDTDLEGTPTLGELTPPWVSPVIVLLLIAGVAAGIWRGRRFGPLVRERLPVTVRVGETTEGRARLYARAGDAPHAAAQLRGAALRRLARRLGLGPAARADQIADAAATRTGLDRRAVHGILIDDIPASGADLLGLRTRIRDLEEAVDTALRPERKSR